MFMKIMFMTTTFLSTLMVISSSSWLSMWMALEINLISFLPVMYVPSNLKSAESCMIYFLIQSLGSIMMLMSILLNSSIINSPYLMEEFFMMTLMFSLMIKLGVPPLHFWFPEILNKMNWTSCAILMTWQKIAPLTVMSNSIENFKLTPIIVMSACLTGAIGGLNQTSLQKIMGFSSINHMGWMIACMKYSNQDWLVYLIIYSTIVLLIIYQLYSSSTFHINQMFNKMNNITESMNTVIMFLSLAATPPTLGFLIKWLVMQNMIINKSYVTLFIMIMSSLLTLFYYLRLISTNFLIQKISLKWEHFQKNKTWFPKMAIFINLALPLTMMVSS